MKTDLLWSNGVNADAYFIVSPQNRFYFTGFRSSFGYLVVTRNRILFATDSRYQEAAEAALGKSCEFIFGTPLTVFPKLVERLKQLEVKSVALEDMYLTQFEYCEFSVKFAGFIVLPMGDAVLKLRQIKTPEEIDCIKRAEDISSEAFNKVLAEIKPNVTELDIAIELEYIMKKLGAEGLAFDTIVASGANSSKPHAVPTNKKVQPGDVVLMDYGAKYNGYCADITRTVMVGKNQDDMKSVYDIVLKAQMYAIANIKAGISCREADSYAREFIVANGFENAFGHSLGHGVGIDIHEAPSVSPSGNETLEEGMIISIEPGIYLPGKGGVRIEDIAVVKKDGLVNLTIANKELIIL